MLESPVKFATNQAITRLIERYCPRINASILDIGCGKGNYLDYFVGEAIKGKYLGIDVKEDDNWHRRKSKANEIEVSFKVHDAQSLEVLNEKFDFICAIQSLEHVADDEKAGKGMRTLLKDGGYTLMTVPSRYSYFLYGPHGHRRYNVFRIKKLASQSSLSIEELVKLGGMATFMLHFVLWTIPAVIFGLKIWLTYKRLGFRNIITKLESFAMNVDKICPWLEGGYAVILKGKL